MELESTVLVTPLRTADDLMIRMNPASIQTLVVRLEDTSAAIEALGLQHHYQEN